MKIYKYTRRKSIPKRRISDNTYDKVTRTRKSAHFSNFEMVYYPERCRSFPIVSPIEIDNYSFLDEPPMTTDTIENVKSKLKKYVHAKLPKIFKTN
jgi:hypothetical protein